MTEGFVDQRRNERFRLRVPASIVQAGEVEDNNAFGLVTSDICSGGAYFQTDAPLPVGTKVKIEMILDIDRLKLTKAKKACIRVSGSVIRATKTGMAICFADNFTISPLKEPKRTG
jgi:hypothetical protein